MRQLFNSVNVISTSHVLGELEKELRLSANKDLVLKQYDYCYTYSKIKALSRDTQKKLLVGARKTGEGSSRIL